VKKCHCQHTCVPHVKGLQSLQIRANQVVSIKDEEVIIPANEVPIRRNCARTPQQVLFVKQMDSHRALLQLCPIPHFLGEMVSVDQDVFDSKLFASAEPDAEERCALDRDQALWNLFGQRSQPGSKASRQQESLGNVCLTDTRLQQVCPSG
jgi:hypothetical protein